MDSLLDLVGEDQILVSNSIFYLKEEHIMFLHSLRDEKGKYKYDFKFRIYLG